jgi:hypothetical protein
MAKAVAGLGPLSTGYTVAFVMRSSEDVIPREEEDKKALQSEDVNLSPFVKALFVKK